LVISYTAEELLGIYRKHAKLSFPFFSLFLITSVPSDKQIKMFHFQHVFQFIIISENKHKQKCGHAACFVKHMMEELIGFSMGQLTKRDEVKTPECFS